MGMGTTVTLLEETRQCHEDIERLERLICNEFREYRGDGATSSSKTRKSLLKHEYTVLDMLEKVQKKAGRLVQIYDDGQGERDREIHQVLRGKDPFETYYRFVEELDAFYGDGGEDVLLEGYDEGCRRALRQSGQSIEDKVSSMFSGEEGLGRYLDLNDVYRDRWLGIYAGYRAPSEGNDMSYEVYVGSCLEHGHREDLDRIYKMKIHTEYVKYLNDLLDYLVSFYKKIHPLHDWDSIQAGAVERFEQAWQDELESSWTTDVFGEHDTAKDWESRYKTAKQIEKGLGGEKMKLLLASMGLKCGGTMEQRAARLFSVRGKSRDEIDPSLFASKSKKDTSVVTGNGGTSHTVDMIKCIANAEFMVKHMCTQLLERQWRATIEKIEKRQAQTYEEFVADMQAEIEGDVLEDDVFADDGDDDEYTYNPLKLPMGWDGKPIPYWMYKLHGLNHEYKCEICGNASYWGRRQFEKHFMESKHVAGMKALGIPNTRQFFEITSITEAVNLWKSIQNKKKEDVEEFEDADGNIYDKKLFTDLQKQGML